MKFDYNILTERNLGLLNEEQQFQIKNSHIALFGVGGLGGVIAEVLVRSGIGSITIVDRDVFDPTNLNRQIFAFSDTVGRPKIDVTEEYLHKINPELNIRKDTTATDKNIDFLMKDVNVALLALDDIIPCIHISRYACKCNIALVEGWAIPFGNVRVFTSGTPTLEEVYEMPTIGKDVNLISDEERKALNLQMLYKIRSIEGINEYYSEFAVERVKQGKITSFAPMVWLTAILMATEALKIILNMGNISLSPSFSLYDPYKNSIPK
jgi:molybdopterin/thiamine biosynthesis adenylyltransferase